MVMQAAKFTPEVLLSAPRRSTALPNKTGEKALYTVSTYSFEEHEKKSQIKLLDIASGQSTTLYEGLSYSEPVWVGKDDFVFIKDLGKGKSSLLFADASKPGSEPQEVEAFEGTIANAKVKDNGDGTYAFACSALATSDGKLHNPEAEEKPHSSARLYDSLYVRHWDAYRSKNRDAIWYGSLKRSTDGKLELQKPGLINALKGSGLESPVPTFGGAGDFDISSSGLVFVAKDPVLNESLYTKSDAYYVPLRSFTDENPSAPQIILTGNLVGYANSPAFSPDGNQVAFTRMRNNRYESDKTRIILVPNIKDLGTVIEIHESEDGEGRWDYRPSDITWAPDAKELFVTAENRGRNQIWRVPLPVSTTAKGALPLPTPLSVEGSVGEFKFLRNGDSSLLVSSTSLIDNSTYYVVDPREQKVSLISSVSKGGKTFGLSLRQIDDFYFDGGGDYKVHALVVKPSNFDSSKKYPLALLIHGGPQGAWLDSWSTRWNPAVFAEQGYVVVAPNPTGSTGYGQKFQDDIAQNWGGNPYQDIVKCFDYVEANFPYVDIDRAVALGASYGGYMMNWIQGHPLGRKFKALVCHDGIFSTMNSWSTDELFFLYQDFGGPVWEKKEAYEKWNPANHLSEWQTPQLVIHNELDYRLPISEGLAAFNVLQTRGVPSKFLSFPDENHWTLKPENARVWHAEVFAWINYYSGITKSRGHGDSS